MLPYAHSASGLAGFAFAYALVLVLPGANFLIVAQASTAVSRRAALSAAGGIGVGATLLAAVAMSGATLLSSSHTLVCAAKVIFAAILVKIGLGALRRGLARDITASDADAPIGAGGYFCAGLVSAVTNPFTSAFFVSAFMGLRCASGMCGHEVALVVVFCVATLWFAAIGLALSHQRVRLLYVHLRRPLDVVVGTMLVGTGVMVCVQ